MGWQTHSPQNVVPSVNHWMPDANAKRTGVVDRMTPAKPPTTRPDMPGSISPYLRTQGRSREDARYTFQTVLDSKDTLHLAQLESR